MLRCRCFTASSQTLQRTYGTSDFTAAAFSLLFSATTVPGASASARATKMLLLRIVAGDGGITPRKVSAGVGPSTSPRGPDARSPG
eukprot:scaffold1486_cov329-Prasinococcus_capsulatus_cf.AAC.3